MYVYTSLSLVHSLYYITTILETYPLLLAFIHAFETNSVHIASSTNLLACDRTQHGEVIPISKSQGICVNV